MSAGDVLWVGFKWLLVPTAMGFAGYYFLGSQVGRVPELEQGAEKVRGMLESSDPRQSVDIKKSKFDDVDLNIRVEEVDNKGEASKTKTSRSQPRTKKYSFGSNSSSQANESSSESQESEEDTGGW